jgi:cytochrome c oxidase subunit 1
MSGPAVAPPPEAERPSPAADGGLVARLGSTDHKQIARTAMLAAGAFFLAGGVLALLMRAELARPELQLLSTGDYNALFTVHGSTMIYLFMVPAALALGLYLVPLQVGAPELAAPRAALAGLWLYIAGGAVIYLGFLTQSGPGRATWIGMDPLSEEAYTPGTGMDLWIFGVILATAGSLLLAACILATAMRRRAPGMTLLRMPVFSWTMVATALMVLFAFPVLIVALALLWIDRQYGGVYSGNSGALTYQHLFWFYGHPVVYVMFFPFVGAVAEVFATFSGRRLFGYAFFVGALLLFTSLSMSVWAHHMFTTGQVTNRYFATTSTLLAVPAGVEYFDLIATLWRGRLRLTTPFLFGLGFLLQFLVGGLTGIWVASPPLDYHVNNSYFVVAHFHYTLFGGSLFGLFAALYYWWPKITGHLLHEGLGKVHFWLTVAGGNLTFFPMFFLGQDGMTRRIADYPDRFATLNLLSSIGAGLIAVSVAVFLANVAVSRRRRRPAGPDPWGGQTLEWATDSPPPRLNFIRPLPPVRSYAPLWDLRHEEQRS